MKRLATIFIGLAALAFSQDQGPRGSEFAAVPAIIPLAELPEFDVADVQVSKATGQPRAQFLPGGKIQFQALPLKFMILAAWGFENDESRITGAPAFANSDKYDIVAKAGPTTEIRTLRLMLRSLLMKRFGLEMHMKDEPLPAYALEKGKAAPKITPSAAEAAPDCKRSIENSIISATCHNLTMDEFAGALRGMAPAYIDRPVVNLTGMSGQYDFKLSWTPRGRLLGTDGTRDASQGGARPDGSVINASDPTAGGITMFESIEKNLGLKLSSGKHPLPVIVVDKLNRTPIDN